MIKIDKEMEVAPQGGGQWKGRFRVQLKEETPIEKASTLDPSILTYMKKFRVEWKGMKSGQEWRYGEYPSITMHCPSVDLAWDFLKVPDNKTGKEAGWVQNVKEDMADILVTYDRGESCILRPVARWQPEGINANDIWYFQRKNCTTTVGSQCVLPDHPSMIVPIFCPITGHTAKEIIGERRLTLRSWMVVRDKNETGLKNVTYLFHVDWELRVVTEFTNVDRIEDKSTLEFKNAFFTKDIFFRPRYIWPDSGNLCDGFKLLCIREGMGEQEPKLGQANQNSEPDIFAA